MTSNDAVINTVSGFEGESLARQLRDIRLSIAAGENVESDILSKHNAQVNVNTLTTAEAAVLKSELARIHKPLSRAASNAEIVRKDNLSASFIEISQKIENAIEKKKLGKEVPKKDQDELKKELSMDEHKVSLDELCGRLGTDRKRGLTKETAAQKRHTLGPNELTPPKQTPKWILFLKECSQLFSLLLWVGSILCFVGYGLAPEDPSNLYLGIVLAIVVFLTACFSFYQNNKSSAIMDSFKNFLPPRTTVIRDGEKIELDARDVTVGDLVLVNLGEKICADLRIIESNGMKVDNSSLTGESEPLSRAVENTHENPLETKNLAFYGTLCAEGSGVGIVINIGDNTVIGRIANLAAATGSEQTTLHREIQHFVHLIAIFAVTLGVVFFIVGLFSYDIITNLVFAIGIIVANVPEGLLATVTVALTMTARRLAVKQVLVKNLEAVETLGATTCICSDKTGTLTQNRMTVSHVWFDGQIFDSAPEHYLAAKPSYDLKAPTFEALKRCATLSCRAFFETSPANMAKEILHREVRGNASDGALLKFVEPLQNVEEYQNAHPIMRGPNLVRAEIPFNSANKWALSIHATSDGVDAKPVLVFKGAPERVIDKCAFIMVNGKQERFTQEWKDKFEQANLELASRGERVLGFAECVLDGRRYNKDFNFDTDTPNFPTTDLTFLGVISLIDPPRPSVPYAVSMCKAAGIKVVMVTGDQPLTAKAIAQQVGIIWSDTVDEVAKKKGIPVKEVDPKSVDAIVVHGSKLAEMSDDELREVCKKQQIVFARTSPQQKLLIVEAFQKLDYVVAVTGDGVNDSPALKKADIGVAMGIAGSDVAKEAADMILLNDDFSSIVQGVQEGRLIFDNLKKSIAYTLSSNIPEITPFVLFIILQIPLPLTTVLILCIDLGTDMIPAISLAYEDAELDIMQRKPRNAKTDRLVSWKLIGFAYFKIGVIQSIAGFFTYFIVFWDYGFHPSMLPGLAYQKIMVNGKDEMIDWLNDKHKDLNLKTLLPGKAWTDCYVDTVSPITHKSVCYTTEALHYAQTAFFTSVVGMQWFNLITCKTRTLSFLTQGMRNPIAWFGLFFETGLALLLALPLGVNEVFFTRPPHWSHFFMPMVPFGTLAFLYDEGRKYVMRTLPRGNWLERFTLY